MKKDKQMTDAQIKDLVRQEIKMCFEEINANVKAQGEDIKEIKAALIGNEYSGDSLVNRVNSHEQYISYNRANKIIERAEPALDQIEDWGKKKMWKKTEDVVDLLGKWKWLWGGLLTLGSIGGIIITLDKASDIIQKIALKIALKQ
jgi:type II secretory pathway component PulJ